PYARDDAPGVVEFLRAASALDPTLRPATPSGWSDYVGESWNHGGRDFRLAITEDGGITGLLMSARIEADSAARHFRIIVHPTHRRCGLGALLLAEVERQD